MSSVAPGNQPWYRCESGVVSNQAVVRRRTSARYPRGFTLIELAAVIGVTSLIALIATSILFAMMQQHSALRAQLLIGNSQMRLANRFRKDVQKAETIELTDSTISLIGPHESVSYAQVPTATIRRTVRVEGAPRSDDFDLQAGHDVRFSIDELGNRKLVTLVIGPREMDERAMSEQPPHAISYRGLTTVAELARDHRWQAEEVTE